MLKKCRGVQLNKTNQLYSATLCWFFPRNIHPCQDFYDSGEEAGYLDKLVLECREEAEAAKEVAEEALEADAGNEVLDEDVGPGEKEDEAPANKGASIDDAPVYKSATIIKQPMASLQQKQPATRSLRAGGGGNAAWGRSESEADETGGGLPEGRQDGAGGGHVRGGRVRGGRGDVRGGRGGVRGLRGQDGASGGRGGLQGQRGRLHAGRGHLGGELRGRGQQRGRRRGRGGGAQAEMGGQEPGCGDCQEEGGTRKFVWFPIPAAKPSAEKKRKRVIVEKEDESDDETEENDEAEASPNNDDEGDDELKKGFKASRSAINARKRKYIRDTRAAAKVREAKNEDIEEGYEGEIDGGDSSDDEEYLPPGAAKTMPKKTRGAGRRTFSSLAYRSAL